LKVRDAIVSRMKMHGPSAGGGEGDRPPRHVSPVGDVRGDPVYRVKADVFRTLGHPARLKLLELLGTGERTVGELQAELGLDSSGVSQHLSALRRSGLLESRKLGTSVHCRLRDRRTLEMLGLAQQIVAANVEDNQLLLDELGGNPAAVAVRSGSDETPSRAHGR
jgi:DNA-binding transcriptional ArsR family regulator